MASVRCLDSAYGFTGFGAGASEIPQQGRILRNLIEGADLVMSHITHFYHLTALDYIRTDYSGCALSGVHPWYPKDQTTDMVSGSIADTLIGHYVVALNLRRKAHELAALMDGKHPCQPAFLPGGVTSVTTAAMTGKMMALLGDNQTQANSGTQLNAFIEHVYKGDIKTVAQAFSAKLLGGTAADGVGKGCGKYLAYGTFPGSTGSQLISSGFLIATNADAANWSAFAFDQANIREYIKHSKYDDGLGEYDGKHPSEGVTKPDKDKAAYSWLKAPRYVVGTTKHVCEVGPLARVLVNYARNVGSWQAEVQGLLTYLGIAITTTNLALLRSVLGRHAARFLECSVVARAMTGWIGELTATATTGETYRHRNTPQVASGVGLTEAPRGALGHWIRVDGKKIGNYQCVVPSTWNLGPKDSDDVNGPVEEAINGSTVGNDAAGRVQVGRIVRSFDPCIACAVHIVSPDKKTVSKFKL